MNLFNLGETVPLNLLLEDGNTSQYPRAYVDKNGVAETTVDLTHIIRGRYNGNWTPATLGIYSVTYIVYSDAGRTIENTNYTRDLERWRGFDLMVDSIWNELLSGHTIVGSAGEVLGRIPAVPAGARERVVQGYTFKQAQNLLEGLLWLEVDGQLDTSVTSASVDFRDSAGNLIFTLTDSGPDANGIFRVSRVNPGFTGDQIVYAVATITIPGPRTITTAKTITMVS